MTSVEIRKKFLACRQYKLRGVIIIIIIIIITSQLVWDLDDGAKQKCPVSQCLCTILNQCRTSPFDCSYNTGDATLNLNLFAICLRVNFVMWQCVSSVE